jgi:hypothetical protein
LGSEFVPYTGPAHAVYQRRPFALKCAFTNLVQSGVPGPRSPTITTYAAPAAVRIVADVEEPGGERSK